MTITVESKDKQIFIWLAVNEDPDDDAIKGISQAIFLTQEQAATLAGDLLKACGL